MPNRQKSDPGGWVGKARDAAEEKGRQGREEGESVGKNEVHHQTREAERHFKRVFV